jgi:hypothetical protein
MQGPGYNSTTKRTYSLEHRHPARDGGGWRRGYYMEVLCRGLKEKYINSIHIAVTWPTYNCKKIKEI